MQVTYSYKSDAESQHTSSASKKEESKSFSFWTFVQLGTVTTNSTAHSQHGSQQALSPTSTTEARRAALDKRRSMIGLSLRNDQMPGFPFAQTADRNADLSPSRKPPTSPLSSLKEATILADGSPRRRSSYGLTRRSSSNLTSTTDTPQESKLEISGQRSAEDPST